MVEVSTSMKPYRGPLMTLESAAAAEREIGGRGRGSCHFEHYVA
jgi:hypothetical protein